MSRGVEVVGVEFSRVDITMLLLGIDFWVSTSRYTIPDLACCTLTACVFANGHTL